MTAFRTRICVRRSTEEPCGQRNYPRIVEQLVELALSTFGQRWLPTAIQIYGRLQELQDSNCLDLFESDTWRRSYARHTNKHLKIWTAWEAVNYRRNTPKIWNGQLVVRVRGARNKGMRAL
ncbi:hypothetical protein MGYG_05357 [Nannizzia gypsea CBS 118893]|uniref:Uncharacterized protein n=1 Tax=Arthroderma gypseum (strain ATCC MYA-4604 / CBS 118893) TaxID=535722 RepID=E4UVN3_ARTGP|nr:hypothetical protein MGYG_05357 [Nannizzia gypsea CBS 118893]EFR02360.1 hypothetical protein MGYG_05357 [Nannizzia gypsea CBS 118893]